jgi:hypothetical protein
MPWEDVLCKDFDPRGIIYIGDSVGAHFHFPESWINPLLISEVSVVSFLMFCLTSDFALLDHIFLGEFILNLHMHMHTQEKVIPGHRLGIQ